MILLRYGSWLLKILIPAYYTLFLKKQRLANCLRRLYSFHILTLYTFCFARKYSRSFKMKFNKQNMYLCGKGKIPNFLHIILTIFSCTANILLLLHKSLQKIFYASLHIKNCQSSSNLSCLTTTITILSFVLYSPKNTPCNIPVKVTGNTNRC